MPPARGRGRAGGGTISYDAWTVAKLKAELSRRGLTANSWDKKSALLGRLRESDAARRRTGGGTQPHIEAALAPTPGAALAPTPEAAPDANRPQDSDVESATLSDFRQELAALRQELYQLRNQQSGRSSGEHDNVTTPQRAPLPSPRLRDRSDAAPGESLVHPPPQRGSPPFARDIPGSVLGPDPRETAASGWITSPDVAGVRLHRDSYLPTTYSGATRIPAHLGHNAWPANATLQPDQTMTPRGPVDALQTQGTPSGDLPFIELVSSQLRSDIVQGKDVNLASLLIQGYTSESELGQRFLVFGSEAVPLRPLKDQRLKKPLTIQEFIKAFSIYRNIMCQVYPNRRDELDMYLRTILELSNDFGGFMFYDYHREFSARAATLLHDFGMKVDWSRRDNDLFCKIFAGRRANSCTLCGTVSHTLRFCPLAADPVPSRPGGGQNPRREKHMINGREACNNFNAARGCSRAGSCPYLHACIGCGTMGHGRGQCRRSDGNRGESDVATAKTAPSTDRAAPRLVSAKARATPAATSSKVPGSGN